MGKFKVRVTLKPTAKSVEFSILICGAGLIVAKELRE